MDEGDTETLTFGKHADGLPPVVGVKRNACVSPLVFRPYPTIWPLLLIERACCSAVQFAWSAAGIRSHRYFISPTSSAPVPSPSLFKSCQTNARAPGPAESTPMYEVPTTCTDEPTIATL